MEPLLPEDVGGAWGVPVLPLGPSGGIDLARLEAEVDALLGSGIEGLHGGGASGELAGLDESQARAVHALLVERGEDAGLPVVLDASCAAAERARGRMEQSRGLEPAAWLVRVPGLGRVGSEGGELEGQLRGLSRLAHAAAPASLLLEEPWPRAFDAASLARFAEAVPEVAGARILPRDGTEEGDEAWAALASVAEELALLAAGREWASAHRWGARACGAELAALTPTGAAAFAELLEEDVQRALRIERRLQHFLEAHALPATARRGRSPAALERLLVLAGGWCDVGPRGLDDASSLDPDLSPRLLAAAESLLAALLG